VIELLGGRPRFGVERQQRAALRARERFQRVHQHGGDAAASKLVAHEQLLHFGSMQGVVSLAQFELHRADGDAIALCHPQCAIGAERGGDAIPEAQRGCPAERREKTDRCAAVHAIAQQIEQAFAQRR